MRIWSLHPLVLDQIGLIACWRETLLAQKVLKGETKGYKNHSQLNRFKMYENPLLAISSYLHFLCDEAKTRGYNFDRSKILYKREDCKNSIIPVTKGQLWFELEHLYNKQKTRKNPDKVIIEIYPIFKGENKIANHPIFYVVDGGIEDWEKI